MAIRFLTIARQSTRCWRRRHQSEAVPLILRAFRHSPETYRGPPGMSSDASPKNRDWLTEKSAVITNTLAGCVL